MGVIVQTGRALADIERARTNVPPTPPPALRLFRVLSSTPISGQHKRWLYSMRRAIVRKKDASLVDTYEPQLSSSRGQCLGLSASELSNAGATYSYGVLKTNVPAGFAAVQIPNGTHVVAFPSVMQDGGTVWIIINTQALDGSC